MSTSKYVDKLCVAAAVLALAVTVLFMLGERLGITVIRRNEDENTSAMFTQNDLDDDWDVNGATEIELKGNTAKITGGGAYFGNNTLYIMNAGYYVISGKLEGSVQIEADRNDKIRLLFDGVDITSRTTAPLYIKQADKVFLTLRENSQNRLVYESEDESPEIDGSIYSRDDLTINGKGELVVESGHHGIVCNDSLVFAGGNISITAKNDAVHAHDAIRICDANITVSAGDDGLHAGNDDENSIFYFESGHISITECYEGIEANDITIAGGVVDIVSTDDGINASGSGDASTITIFGGDITIINPSGRDADGLDSNGNIYINGGNLFISVLGSGTNNAIDYGSENGGKCIISGGTVIACGSGQMAEAPDSDSSQGFIMQMVSGNENDVLSLVDSSGKKIISREIPCSFTSVIISSPELAVGDSVKLMVGDEVTDITVSNVYESVMGSRGGPPRQMTNGNERGEMGRPEVDWQGGGGRPAFEPSENDNQNRPGFEPPENDNRNRPDNFNERNPNPNGQNPMPDFRIDKVGDRVRMPGERPNGPFGISNSTLIFIGISVLILLIGLCIAIRKKY